MIQANTVLKFLMLLLQQSVTEPWSAEHSLPCDTDHVTLTAVHVSVQMFCGEEYEVTK